MPPQLSQQRRDSLSEFDELAGPDGEDVQLAELELQRQQQQQQDGAPPAGPAGPPQTVPYDRFKEVEQQRDSANEMRDQVILGALRPQPAPMQQQQQGPPQPPQGMKYGPGGLLFPEDADDDTLKLIAPAIQAYGQQVQQNVIQAVEGRYGRTLNAVEHKLAVENLDERVPGFSENLMPEVQNRLSQMHPDLRQKYDNEQGVEALSWQIRAERAEQQLAGTGDLSMMAQQTPGGPPPPAPRVNGENAIWAMPEDEFDARYPVNG